MTSQIEETIRQLGCLILNTEEYKAMQAAESVYQKDEGLAALVREFEINRTRLLGARAQETPDEATIADLQNRLQAIYEQIEANEKMKKYQAATAAFEGLMKSVLSGIQNAVFGEPCTHDCSTCSGCH